MRSLQALKLCGADHRHTCTWRLMLLSSDFQKLYFWPHPPLAAAFLHQVYDRLQGFIPKVASQKGKATASSIALQHLQYGDDCSVLYVAALAHNLCKHPQLQCFRDKLEHDTPDMYLGQWLNCLSACGQVLQEGSICRNSKPLAG